jgi:uncharacterized protein YjbI with pentapeptide repeats
MPWGIDGNSLNGMGWKGRKIHAGADLVRADLAGARLAGVELGTASHKSEGAADLTGADLRGADLTGAKLIGVDFTMADLREATLDRAVLERANFKAALMDGASFKRADFRGGLAKARPNMVDFSHASMVGVSLVEANLQSISMSGADLTGADFSRADLLGAHLNGNLANADFTGARFPTWGGKEGDVTSFSGSILTGVDLSHVGGIWLSIARCDLSGTDFGSADLSVMPFVGVGWLEEHCASDLYSRIWGVPKLVLPSSDLSSTAINWAGFRGIFYAEEDWGGVVWPEGFNLKTDATVISDESEAIALLEDWRPPS